MDMGYVFYMAESEGLLPTRIGKINAIIKAIRTYPAPSIDIHTFHFIVREHGINPESLTSREIRYINSAIK